MSPNRSFRHVERCFDNPIKDPLPWYSNIFLSTPEEIFIKSVLKETLFLSLDKKTVSLTPWQNSSAKVVKSFPSLSKKPKYLNFFCQKNTKVSMGFLKSSFHIHICTLMTKSSENFRCCFKNKFKKKFSPEKRVFLFFLECFSWHSEYSFNDYFKKFCHDSKKSLMNVWKKNKKSFFETISLNFCIWIIRTFLWQSWRIVPAKRPKFVPLRSKNIIFSDKDIQKKSIEKVESSFDNPVIFVLAECPENYRSRFGKCKFFTKQLCYFHKKLSAKVRTKLLSGPIKKTIPDRSLWTQILNLLHPC